MTLKRTLYCTTARVSVHVIRTRPWPGNPSGPRRSSPQAVPFGWQLVTSFTYNEGCPAGWPHSAREDLHDHPSEAGLPVSN